MKTTEEYKNNQMATENGLLLKKIIEAGEYLQPILDLHCTNVVTGEMNIWLKCVDKNGSDFFVILNENFMKELSKNMIIARAKSRMNGMKP